MAHSTRSSLLAASALCLGASLAQAADQTVTGAGNQMAAALAKRSPLVRTALLRLNEQISTLTDQAIREQTEDALFNPEPVSCIVQGSAEP